MGRFVLFRPSFAARAILAAIPLAVLLTVSVTAFGQTPSNPDPSVLFTALLAKNWPVVVGFALYWAFAFVKQGWVGTWLQAKIPARFLPIISPVVAALGAYCADLLAGQSFSAAAAAILPGLLAGFLPVVGHEVVVESMRGGRELVPAKGGKPTGSGTDAKAPGPYSDKMPPVAKRGRLRRWVPAIALGAAFPIGVGGAAVVASMPVATEGCTPAQGAEVLSVLQQIESWAQVILSGAEALWPVVEPLIPAASQAQATTDFNNATASLAAALAGASNDAAAVVNATTISADIAAIQAAVQQVDSIVQIWTGGSGDASAALLGSGGASVRQQAGAVHALAVRIQGVRP